MATSKPKPAPSAERPANRTAAILFVLAAVIGVAGVALYSWRAAVIVAAVMVLFAAVANTDIPDASGRS